MQVSKNGGVDLRVGLFDRVINPEAGRVERFCEYCSRFGRTYEVVERNCDTALQMDHCNFVDNYPRNLVETVQELALSIFSILVFPIVTPLRLYFRQFRLYIKPSSLGQYTPTEVFAHQRKLIRSLRSELSQAKSDNEDWQKCSKLNKSALIIQKAWQERCKRKLLKAISELRQEHAHAEARINRLEVDILDLETKVRLTSEAFESEKQHDALAQSRLKERLLTVQAELDTARRQAADMQESLETQLRDLNDTLNKSTSQAKKKKGELIRQKGDLKTTCDELRAQNIELNSYLERMNALSQRTIDSLHAMPGLRALSRRGSDDELHMGAELVERVAEIAQQVETLAPSYKRYFSLAQPLAQRIHSCEISRLFTDIFGVNFALNVYGRLRDKHKLYETQDELVAFLFSQISLQEMEFIYTALSEDRNRKEVLPKLHIILDEDLLLLEQINFESEFKGQASEGYQALLQLSLRIICRIIEENKQTLIKENSTDVRQVQRGLSFAGEHNKKVIKSLEVESAIRHTNLRDLVDVEGFEDLAIVDIIKELRQRALESSVPIDFSVFSGQVSNISSLCDSSSKVYSSPQEFPKPIIKHLQRYEILARSLAYGGSCGFGASAGLTIMKKESVVYAPGLNGEFQLYAVEDMCYHKGLSCMILAPLGCKNGLVHVLFRGTDDFESIKRDRSETIGFGVFAEIQYEILLRLAKAVEKYEAKEISISGHSLGGLDSMRFLAYLTHALHCVDLQSQANESLGKEISSSSVQISSPLRKKLLKDAELLMPLKEIVSLDCYAYCPPKMMESEIKDFNNVLKQMENRKVGLAVCADLADWVPGAGDKFPLSKYSSVIFFQTSSTLDALAAHSAMFFETDEGGESTVTTRLCTPKGASSTKLFVYSGQNGKENDIQAIRVPAAQFAIGQLGRWLYDRFKVQDATGQAEIKRRNELIQRLYSALKEAKRWKEFERIKRALPRRRSFSLDSPKCQSESEQGLRVETEVLCASSTFVGGAGPNVEHSATATSVDSVGHCATGALVVNAQMDQGMRRSHSCSELSSRYNLESAI